MPGTGLSTLHQIISLYDATLEILLLTLTLGILLLTVTDEETETHRLNNLPKVTRLVNN